MVLAESCCHLQWIRFFAVIGSRDGFPVARASWGGDSSDSLHEDESGLLTIVIGPYRLTSAGPVRIQRLITEQFYRIAIRCDRFTDGASVVGRVNLTFYSDPRFCEGGDFRLDTLDISKIPMPSLYLEAYAGEPILNAKLQMLDREETAAVEAVS